MARDRRAPPRGRGAGRRSRPAAKPRKQPPRRARVSKGRPDLWRFRPTLERYTPALLAHVRQQFEETPEPVASLAADLGIAPQSVNRIARRYGWVRRNAVPARDLPPALQILQEAQGLEVAVSGVAPVGDPNGAASPPPLAKGRSPSEARRVGIAASPELIPTRTASQSDLLFARGGEVVAPPELSEGTVVPELSCSLQTIERLERAVLAELATVEAMRAAMGTLPHKPPGAARTVRTLGMLTQTLQHLQRLRASEALQARAAAGSNGQDDHDDDRPRDIDEFRRDLARRIDAFVESRTDGGGARGDAVAEAVDRT